MANVVGLDVELVFRRSEYLDALFGTKRRKGELEDVLGHSRSTVNRAIGDLVDAGLVEEGEGACQLTLEGRLAVEAFSEFRGRNEGIAAAADLFPAVGPESDIGLEVTTGADVTAARGSMPYRAFHEFERLIEEATRIRGSAWTFANPRSKALFEEAIVERGVPVEFFLDETLFEQIRDDFGEAFDRWHDRGDFAGFVVPECPRYTILVSELPSGPETGVAVYSTDHEFYGVLINDTAKAVQWAERQLDALAERAIPFAKAGGGERRNDHPGSVPGSSGR